MDNEEDEHLSSSTDESAFDEEYCDFQQEEVFKGIEWILDCDDLTESEYLRYITRFLAEMEDHARRLDKQTRQRKIHIYKRSLISKSTVHGLRNCFDRKSRVRRFIWTILLLTAVGLLMQKLYECTMHFISHPFSTTTTVRYEDSMRFPAVSICNLNDMRTSVMKGTKLDMILKGDRNVSLSGDEYRNTIRKANHELPDMLYKCKILDKECSVQDFIQFNKDQGDRCFTFNHGHEGQQILFFNKTGPTHALELILNIEEYEYYPGTDYSGIQLILHGQDETPVKMLGVMLSPGFITYVQVKRRKIKNLPPPYKSNCGSKKLKYFSERYSKHLCWLETLTDHVIEECGCKEWFMPGGYRVCSLNESKECMWPRWAEFDKYMKYDCPLPCVMDTYTPSLSLSQFLLDRDVDEIAQDPRFRGAKEMNRKTIRGTFVKAVIFYGELSYEYSEQVPSYDKLDFLADIGGQLGLFLGSSALTYMEFIDCLVMIIYTKYISVKP
ncbi:acid-sensing ion channel 1B-like [Rhopilema esculentum]|uniref:acid-sensing ion channel 1B-like n=1 Tax=Rhopilema esculentum TaxID=499914 RepID=UPI0031E22992